MWILFWNDFKTKLNERFIPHNQILKDMQKLLRLHQGGPIALVHYVQNFNALLSLILMKKKYAHKVTFFHGLQFWGHKLILP
jgi:hypothetical protein